MCLVIFQPANSPMVPRSVFDNAFRANKDGAGFMFAAVGTLTIRKAFHSVNKLWKAYKRDYEVFGKQSPFIVHFRYATHGNNERDNIHPHSLADGKVGLVHNGILSDFDWFGKSSDTVNFCRSVLACRTPEQLLSAEFGVWLGKFIGTGNKLALMDNHGNTSIVNSELGIREGAYWYSNTDYKPRPIVPKWTRAHKQSYQNDDMRALFTPPGCGAWEDIQAETDRRMVEMFEDGDIGLDYLDDRQWQLACAAMSRDGTILE